MLGYDAFITLPGQFEEITCSVCGSTCDIRRGLLGPTSWASAMSKHETIHDRFDCPHQNETWHITALELVKAIETTPSKRVAALMQADLLDLLTEHGCSPTK